MPRAALGFCSANRAENLCYQFNHGQKLLPQFRKIVGLVYSSGREHPHPKRKLILSVLINGMCNFEDVIKPPTASFRSGLLTFTHSSGTYKRNLLIRSALINGLCIFEDETRAATAASL